MTELPPCPCGAALTYSGRGRPPAACPACRAEKERARKAALAAEINLTRRQRRRIRREDVARLYAAGKLDAEIAAELGVDRSTVARHRDALGLPSRSSARVIPAEEVAELERLVDERVPFAEISRSTGVHPETLRKLFPGRAWTPEERAEYQAALRLWDDVDAAAYAAETRDVGKAHTFNRRTSGERLAA